MNVITLMGRIGKAPELRQMPNSDDKICSVGLANSSWKKVNNEWVEETSWFDVTFFGRSAERVADKGKPGARIIVTGNLKQRKWQDQEGKTRERIGIQARQVQFLDKVKKTEPSEEQKSDVPF